MFEKRLYVNAFILILIIIITIWEKSTETHCFMFFHRHLSTFYVNEAKYLDIGFGPTEDDDGGECRKEKKKRTAREALLFRVHQLPIQ